MSERTLVLIKPDAVERNLQNNIIKRYEDAGLKIINKKQMVLSVDVAKKLYEEHAGKWFFDRNVNYITSGALIALIIEGDNVIQRVRTINGKTDPSEAEKGTIRGDYGLGLPNNTVHSSDSLESVIREIGILFSPLR